MDAKIKERFREISVHVSSVHFWMTLQSKMYIAMDGAGEYSLWSTYYRETSILDQNLE